MPEYLQRCKALNKSIESSKYSKAAVARLAGLTERWQYIYALNILSGKERAEPTLRKLEKAWHTLSS